TNNPAFSAYRPTSSFTTSAPTPASILLSWFLGYPKFNASVYPFLATGWSAALTLSLNSFCA
ncbi:MAG: hypothetical protein WCR46_14390, partial [Deltaproteobacteria bacterium]